MDTTYDFSIEEWSSENEMDAAFPQSIKSQIKRLYQKTVSSTSPTLKKYITETEDLKDLNRNFQEMTINGKKKAKAYTCDICGHTFELPRTLKMHKKVCPKK